jgi:hypothetical protein
MVDKQLLLNPAVLASLASGASAAIVTETYDFTLGAYPRFGRGVRMMSKQRVVLGGNLMRGYLLAVGALFALAAGPAHAANLLTNGDFSAGNTGFESDYDFESFINNNTQYSVTAASNINNINAFGDWTAISADPSGGDGNILVANGSTDSSLRVWFETVAVTPNTNYTFNFFGVDVNAERTSDAVLEPVINSTLGLSLLTNGTWQASSFSWNSGASTTATIALIDTNLNNAFNDFAIDDLSFAAAGGAVPETSTWVAMLIGFAAIGFLGYRKTNKPAAA